MSKDKEETVKELTDLKDKVKDKEIKKSIEAKLKQINKPINKWRYSAKS